MNISFNNGLILKATFLSMQLHTVDKLKTLYSIGLSYCLVYPTISILRKEIDGKMLLKDPCNKNIITNKWPNLSHV